MSGAGGRNENQEVLDLDNAEMKQTLDGILKEHPKNRKSFPFCRRYKGIPLSSRGSALLCGGKTACRRGEDILHRNFYENFSLEPKESM